MIKVSDYVVKKISEYGVKDIFMLSGGGMMHLLDSIGRSKDIGYICNHNEQATAMCAESYGQLTNNLGVCFVTTGPGGTNAVTGTTAAWLDSTPMLVISGQVKRTDLVGESGVRQVGPQEVDIVSIVRPVTKYAVTVMEPYDIRYEIEKAVHIATTGRRGPVWVDIPLDIQGAMVDKTKLRPFEPEEEESRVSDNDVELFYNLLNNSKRPVILIGHGVVASKAQKLLNKLVSDLNIPVLSSWRAKTVMEYDHPLYFGHPGTPAHRSSNFILQNSDFLLVIGARLNPGMTGFNERDFAPKAKKIIVDIDINEMNRINMDFEAKIHSDSYSFINRISMDIKKAKEINRSEWMEYCNKMRLSYPVITEDFLRQQELVNAYVFIDKMSDRLKEDEIIVNGCSGRASAVMALALKHKKEQKYITSFGLGSMGYAIPSSIGACVAGGRKRTVTMDGDGSFQLNIQELQTIRSNNLPIKMFILNNGGYASIMSMQDRHFGGNYVGCNASSGVSIPDLERIAYAYGIKYTRIMSNDEIDNGLDKVFDNEGPFICEIMCPRDLDEIPKVVSRVAPDGSMLSSCLEDLFPFLDREEFEQNMSISRNEGYK